ncbi:MAG: ABC transporter ATP-binding protein [Sphaerochaetaceae bacterium]|jgi:NitT/TauT family transport system ATP-binding protein|nr:ABC transporter ATP-binding protein [Sphaerochaetaceae bacterium]MDD2405865.1 ABC transporter ATP-binding protein [Sphaerochaetaceae bacterium]NLO69955.1 ABC transporter ATP-binding protein [Porphyromonadaceae bacterium]
MSEKVIIKNLKKVYSGRNGDTIALNGIDLTIGENEFVSIVGPSGCGKSTLLNIIAGLLEPTEGIVICDNKPVEGTGADRGVVFQQYALFPWLTVRKNIEYGLKIQKLPDENSKRGWRKLSKKEILEICNRYISMVQLEEFANSYPKELSGGMKQRVALARAYAVNPKILLLDEPFGALDAQTRTQLQQDLLETWEREAKTCLFITHDIEEAIILGNRVVIMSARPGRIKEIVKVDIPYPRDQKTKISKEFIDIKNYVWSQVYEEYLSFRK